MKKITKIVMAIMLALAVCATIVPSEKADAKSKNIYFAGEYRRTLGEGEQLILQMNPYSSPEGKTVGNYEVYYYYKPSGGMKLWGDGEIKRTGKNKYRYSDIKFRVYKKKIVISGKSAKSVGFDGTYKLKKRYPMP